MYVLWTVLTTLCFLNKAGLVGCQSISSQAQECYNNSTCPCCSVPCPSDSSGQCGGICIDGYHGGKCYNRCPYNCITCVDAKQGGGVSNCTLCKDGYYSTTSRYQCQSNCSTNCKSCKSNDSHCTSCHDEYFLTESGFCAKCNEACATCTSYNTCTSCNFGFFLNQNDALCQKCSPLCYSCNTSETCTCFNGCIKGLYEGRYCDENQCRYGCKTKFTSATANEYTCDTCVDGNFGIESNRQCSENCKFGRCKRISGDCYDCHEGYYGQRCEFRCPMNCEISCEKDSGRCVSCKYGLFGINCTLSCQKNCLQCNITTGSCQVCIDGFHSEKCEKICPEKCQYGRCNKTNGSCTCLSEYTGPTCEVRITNSTEGLAPPLTVPAAEQNNVGVIVGITLAAVVIIVGVGALCYNRRKHDSGNEFAGKTSLFSIAASTSDIEKIEMEIAKTDAELNKLTAHRSELAARLLTLQSSIPYQHTEQADTVEDMSYEMLQTVNNKSLYSSLQRFSSDRTCC